MPKTEDPAARPDVRAEQKGKAPPPDHGIALKGRGQPIDLGPAEILPGTWVGSGECGRRDVTFKLAIRADLKNPGQVIVEAGGGFAPLNLKGGYDPASKRFKLEPMEWRIPGSHNDPFELQMVYLPSVRLLVVDRLAASGKCLGLAARKLQILGLPPNPSGLLFKASPDFGNAGWIKTRQTLTEKDCRGYVLWLASYNNPQEPGGLAATGAAQTRALADVEGMNRVLGKNLWSWTNEDAKRYENLSRVCREKVANTTDVKLAAAVGTLNKHVGWVITPLNIPPDGPASESWYDNALAKVYADLIEDIRVDQRNIREGLIGKGLINVPESPGSWRGRLAAMPLDQFAGEWFGQATCKNQSDPRRNTIRLLRLFVDNSVTPVSARLDLGPYLGGYKVTSALLLDAQYDQASGKVRLTSTKTLGAETHGAVPSALTVNGKFDPGTGDLAGTITGLSGFGLVCDHLDMKRVRRSVAPLNSHGILFQFYLKNGSKPVAPHLDAQQCYRFFRWQTEFESYQIGNTGVYGGLFDQNRLRQVFGKDMYQWDEGDANIARLLTQLCTAVITNENKPEQLAIMTKVASSNVRLDWDVLTQWYSREQPPNHLQLGEKWFQIEYLMREILARSKQFNTKVAEIESAPPTLGLVGRIDGLLAAIAPRTGTVTPYLTPGERAGYDSRLQASRVKAGTGYAKIFIGTLAKTPQTLDGLHQIEARFQKMEKTFRERKLGEGLAMLLSGFREESHRRALALWPEHVRSAQAAFAGLNGADLNHWQTLKGYQDTTSYLLKFIDPGKEGGQIAATYANLEAQKKQLGAAMLARSENKLVSWMQKLPPSLGAVDAVDNFASVMRKVGVDPQARPRIASAMSAVKTAYNPLGLARPDIAGALMRQHRSEVSLGGLEDLAYFMTLTRRIKGQCPEKVEASMGSAGQSALLAFSGQVAMEVSRRAISEGPRSRSEGMRMILLFFNNVANQPGCRIAYGYVIGCTTAQDYFDTQQFIMTSSDGEYDARLLLSSGCSGDELHQYLAGLKDYVTSYSTPGVGRPIKVPSFEDALGVSH